MLEAIAWTQRSHNEAHVVEPAIQSGPSQYSPRVGPSSLHSSSVPSTTSRASARPSGSPIRARRLGHQWGRRPNYEQGLTVARARYDFWKIRQKALKMRRCASDGRCSFRPPRQRPNQDRIHHKYNFTKYILSDIKYI